MDTESVSTDEGKSLLDKLISTIVICVYVTLFIIRTVTLLNDTSDTIGLPFIILGVILVTYLARDDPVVKDETISQ